MTVKEEIIQKALDLFASEGYENIGVQRIVLSVGVTKPTLYHYFGSKEGLLTSILEKYHTPFREGLMKVSQYDQDVIRTMDLVVTYYIEEAKRHPEFYRLNKNLQYSPKDSLSFNIVKGTYEEEFQLIVEMFKAIASHHTNLLGKEIMLAHTLKGQLDGFITYHLLIEDLSEMNQEMCYKMSKQFLYGIFA